MIFFLLNRRIDFRHNTIGYFAEDIDATCAELLERGAIIVEALEDKPWQLRQFTMDDLNGPIFYIYHDL